MSADEIDARLLVGFRDIDLRLLPATRKLRSGRAGNAIEWPQCAGDRRLYRDLTQLCDFIRVSERGARGEKDGPHYWNALGHLYLYGS
jgi:hypothetical protein